MNERIFHYTGRDRLRLILSARAIRPSLEMMGSGDAVAEITWLSCAEYWEPACSAAPQLEPDGLRYDALPEPDFVPDGAARIEVISARVQPWDDGLLALGAEPLELFRLAQLGMDIGADPDSWFVVVGAIQMAEWKAIQIWDGERWRGEQSSRPRQNAEHATGARR